MCFFNSNNNNSKKRLLWEVALYVSHTVTTEQSQHQIPQKQGFRYITVNTPYRGDKNYYYYYCTYNNTNNNNNLILH